MTHRPTSRFFLDKWLGEYNTNTETAGPFNIELLARLQNAKTKTKVETLVPPASSSGRRSKLLTAVACDALDAMCEHLGSSQPALTEIRSVLHSAIFADDCNSDYAERSVSVCTVAQQYIMMDKS